MYDLRRWTDGQVSSFFCRSTGTAFVARGGHRASRPRCHNAVRPLFAQEPHSQVLTGECRWLRARNLARRQRLHRYSHSSTTRSDLQHLCSSVLSRRRLIRRPRLCSQGASISLSVMGRFHKPYRFAPASVVRPYVEREATLARNTGFLSRPRNGFFFTVVGLLFAVSICNQAHDLVFGLLGST